MELEQEILEVLPYPVERTGLQIAREISAKRKAEHPPHWLNFFKRLEVGFDIYPVLCKMEREGWLESRWGESTPERMGLRRRYYRKTTGGTKRLNELKQKISVGDVIPGVIGAEV